MVDRPTYCPARQALSAGADTALTGEEIDDAPIAAQASHSAGELTALRVLAYQRQSFKRGDR
jgi:hypothetical protein